MQATSRIIRLVCVNNLKIQADKILLKLLPRAPGFTTRSVNSTVPCGKSFCILKRTDPNKITRLKGESDAAFKKRKAAIKKEVRESARETSKDQTPPKTSGGKRDARGRLLSKHIPPSRKEMSKAQFRRLVKQGLIGVTKKGETKDIGQYADIPENIMELLYGRGKKLTKTELEELKALGITERKYGSKVIKKKSGGQISTPKGIGAALRGYGKGYK